MKWLLWLYPRRWRHRYAYEFVGVLEGRRFSVPVLLDILRGALDAWMHPELIAVPARVAAGGNPARGSDRFDKFTRRSRTVLDLAAKEAERLGHSHITTEHLLLGMLLEGEGVAAHVLADRGVQVDQLRQLLLQRLESVPRCDRQRVGLSPDAKRALELSIAEANRLRHHYVGTEHLLLGLVAERHSTAADILRLRNAGDLSELRSHIVRVLNEGGPHLRPPF
jgi:Clp amino terminal domain, pathogenicity island component